MKRNIRYFIIAFLFILFSFFLLSIWNNNAFNNKNFKNQISMVKNRIEYYMEEKDETNESHINQEIEKFNSIISRNHNIIMDIPILMFHYIQDIPSNTKDQLWYKLSYSPQNLEKLLIFFQTNNIETLTFWDIIKIINGTKEIPSKAVILTFDDGHKDHYTNAFPVLKKHGAKAVFFIISSKPNKDPKYASWEQIKEISNAGFEIWSHSINHTNISSLSHKNIIHELEQSKIEIEEKTNSPVISFCYPSGKYSKAVLGLIGDYYIFARTTNHGKQIKINERFKLPTIRINPTTKADDLKYLWEK